MADAGAPSDARRRPRAWRRVSERVPGVALVRNYRKEFLRYDLVAGLVLTSLLVPQGMAYAELAGVPAVNGLYATIACLVGYALMGPSRILVLGPDSAVSPMILAAITAVGAMAATDGKQNAIELAGMLAIMVGALEIALGVARLGFVADLLSKEVKVGYLNGLAMVIIFGQLPKLFGFSVKAEHALPKLKEFFTNLDRTNGPTLIIGSASLVALFALTRFAKALPAVLVVI